MVNYAKEYGIDLEKLATESPSHPRQMANHRFQRLMSDIYWETMTSLVSKSENEALQESVETYRSAIARPERKSSAKPPKRKPKRVYHFDDGQLEVAIRSLDRKNDSQEKNTRK